VSAEPAVPAAVRLPDPVPRFAARAARLRRLAVGHAAEDWLLLLARIADGQRTAAQDVSVPPVRAAVGVPPLSFDRVRRDATWRRMLGIVLSGASAADLPPEAVGVVRRLADADAPSLEALADQQLGGEVPPTDLAAAPFVGGALQAWFGVLAGRLDGAAIVVRGSACPVCCAPPVAGVIDGVTRLRYLHCSLCGVEWNVPRLSCVSCASDSGLAYFHVDGDAGAKAEACEACGGYLKLFDLEVRPGAEPVADDTATLALDLLVANEGYGRIGVNPWLWVATPAAPRSCGTTQPAA
jgi:FdhE protein